MKNFLIVLFLYPIIVSGQKSQIKEAVLILEGLPIAGKEVNLMWVESSNSRGAESFDDAKVPLVIFANEWKTAKKEEKERRLALLSNWVEKGAEIGNGTFSDIPLSEVSDLEWFKKDILYGEKNLRLISRAYGDSLRYFRFPHFDLGKDSLKLNELNKFLDSLNYTAVTSTMRFEDELFNTSFINSKIENDSMLIRYIGDRYIEHFLQRVDFYEKLSEKHFHSQIPHIINLRASDINLDLLEYLIYILWMRGYRFISLEKALNSPIYIKNMPKDKRGGFFWEVFKETKDNFEEPLPNSLIEALYNWQTY